MRHYRHRHPRFIFGLLLGLIGLAWFSVIGAQDVADPAGLPSVELLEGRLQETEASSELDEASRSKLLEYYRKAISLSAQVKESETSAAEFARARENAPTESDKIRRQLKRLESQDPPELPDSLARKGLAQLEQQLQSEKADLSGLTSRLADLEAALETQAQRTQLARDRLAAAKTRQTEVNTELQTASPEAESPRLSEARRWALEYELKALGAETEMLDQELRSLPPRLEQLGLQRDRTTLQQNRQLQYVSLLQALVAERRLSEAEIAREETAESERLAFGKHPLVQELAQQNAQLGEELNVLALALEQIAGEEAAATAEAKRIGDNFRLARQKLEIAGLSEALGQILLEQRRGLPDTGDFEAAEARRRQLVVESSLRQIRNQQERARLLDINAYVDDQLATLPETWRSLLRLEILQLAEARRELLDKAIAADDTYLQELGDLDLAQRQLSEAVNAYNQFLDERLLWVRTGKLPSWETVTSITHGLGLFVTPAHWLELGRALVLPDSFPWVLLSGLTIFVILLRQSGKGWESLQRSSRNVGQLRHDRFSATARALLLTLVLALPWPILFTALGLHLQNVHSIDAIDVETHLYQTAEWSGQFVPAIGAAFYGIALYTFYFLAFRIFCAPGGLAAGHFGWQPAVTERLRHEIRRLMTIFLPAAFLLISAVTYDPAALAGGLSRLAFIVVLAALAWFFGRILAPRQGVLSGFYAENPRNLLTWLRYLWPALGVLLPTVLAALATIGYVYTAAQFGARLVDTLWLLVAIILVHQLAVRWLLLNERQLAFKDALERHRAQRAAEAGAEAEGDNSLLQVEEPEVDYSALSEDANKLLNAVLTVLAAFGLWAIWSGVMPAFRILNEVVLWTHQPGDGSDTVVPVTLGDAIVSLLILAVIIAAARRLPALLEFALLARLNITAGSRYAIATLTQYTIVAVGVVMFFGVLGGSWDEIQWLIAALGVGIGFGLQEIVANFICGLILLFERPIRIGDIVTVGETSGVVTRIRIRSTTIRNWDQRELVVPNKEFITGRLLNWTLSDAMARIVIPVGIAYGSDVAQALKLVREAADEHERVLDDPEPLVTFESFGDNALTIMLRCFISTTDLRLQTQSELNEEINRKFNDAGIVIAFPQRDIHLDTTSPLEIRIQQDTAEEMQPVPATPKPTPVG